MSTPRETILQALLAALQTVPATVLRGEVLPEHAAVPAFLLVPQVKLRKRLDLARDVEKVAGKVPRLVVERWRDDR